MLNEPPSDHPLGCMCIECIPTPFVELTEEELEYFAKAIPQFPEKEGDDEVKVDLVVGASEDV